MAKIALLSTVIAILPLLGAAAPATAQDPPVDCRKDDQTTLNICSYRRFQEDDRVLNETYRAMTARLDADEKRYATAAEMAWLKFRDAECLALSGGPQEQGGTIWPLMNNQCLSRLTRHRVEELKQQVSCPAGHLDCPG